MKKEAGELIRTGFYWTLGGIAATSVVSVLAAAVLLLLAPKSKPLPQPSSVKEPCGC